MDKQFFYEIRVKGYLTDRWADWFDGLAICHEEEGETILMGWISDQAALLGVLSKLQALNLTLIELTRMREPKSGYCDTH